MEGYLRALRCGLCGEQTWQWSPLHGPDICTPCRYGLRRAGWRAAATTLQKAPPPLPFGAAPVENPEPRSRRNGGGLR